MKIDKKNLSLKTAKSKKFTVPSANLLPAIIAPTIFPTEVCEFHTPIMNPFLPLPNQFATTVTTPGQPVAWTTPQRI